ncbi:MAG: dipeptide epimerase [Cyanobacteria bacterium P01_A01_bin.84]
MHIEAEVFTVNKRFPLTISRGTTAKTDNVWVKIREDGIEGWGEASPFGVGDKRQTTDVIVTAIEQVSSQLKDFNPLQRQQIEQILNNFPIPSSAKAGIDVALHDWMGKKVGLPLWKMWGLDRNAIAPISVTIGISSPEAARKRTRDWLQFADIKVLKVKLGSPEGLEADKQMLQAVQSEAPDRTFYVDANGGWGLSDAIHMCNWLAELNIIYIEQPLPRGEENQLIELKNLSPLPIFADESIFNSSDIPRLANSVDGINIKLMKSGGLSEAMRMVHTARAYGLQVMFGCYSDSAIANTAALQLAPLADYLDLDSHLNLIDDPFDGASMEEGRILLNDLPGIGVRHSAFSA